MLWQINHTDGTSFTVEADKFEDTHSGVQFLRRGGAQAAYAPNHSISSIVAMGEHDRETEISVMANAIGYVLHGGDGRTVRHGEGGVLEFDASAEEAALHLAAATAAWDHLHERRELAHAS